MEHEGHQSVMVAEVLAALAPRPGEIFADLTLGMGGHALEIVRHLAPGGRLIGLDLDAEMLERAREVLGAREVPIELHHAAFDRVGDVLEGAFGRRDQLLDGILLDLGVSSVHLDHPDRGFSFNRDGPLDMRLDRSQGRTAAELVNRLPAPELERIFREYGEERFARRIARAIRDARARRPFRRTLELADLIQRTVRASGRSRIHPATRVFQALRIAVNDELGRLERALESCCRSLKIGGRMAVISFHSLEDGRVKRAFAARAKEGWLALQTKKPIRPTFEETRTNPRARSARLRAVVRKEQG